jgi:hypothetical protein
MSKMAELDDYHAHEALDRAHTLCESVCLQLLEHPYIKANPEHTALVERAVDALAQLYQNIGDEYL